MTHIGKVTLKKSSTLISLGGVFEPPPVFSAEYQAVIDRAIALGYARPSLHQQILQNTMMESWVSSGVYAKADLIYVLANDVGLDFARINWKDPNSYLLTDTGPEPVKFMLNYGPYVNTENASFGILDTNWLPSTGVNFTLNSNCVITSSLSHYASTGMSYRAVSTAQFSFYCLEMVRVIVNNATVATSASASSNNLTWMNRRTAAAVSNLMYINPSGVVTANISAVAASTARPTVKLGLLGDTSPTTCMGAPMEACFVGGALTDPEFLSYDNALMAYLNALRYVAGLYTTGNYTVPAGITQIFVECWGGGGAGRGYPNAVQTTTGGGGGGGAYAASVVNVTPAQVIPFVIGAGGVGGVGAGAVGGDTSWNSGAILAKGGAGGPASSARAVGGLASASVGTIKYNGGAGGAGGTVLNASTGSGGSAAGALGDGVTGVDAVAAMAITTRPFFKMLGAGVPGYSQANTSDINGVHGMQGSGGGGSRRATVTKNGGNGGQGYIRISASKVY